MFPVELTEALFIYKPLLLPWWHKDYDTVINLVPTIEIIEAGIWIYAKFGSYNLVPDVMWYDMMRCDSSQSEVIACVMFLRISGFNHFRQNIAPYITNPHLLFLQYNKLIVIDIELN